MTSQRTRDRLVQRLRDAGITNEQVLAVMATTPRHLFIDEALAHHAYEDTPLPIGHGQTISQPYTVARMTELLLADQQRLGRVLEVGTGCGYQSAVLSPFVDQLYSVERIEPLYQRARNRLYDLRYRNVNCSLSDGGWGLPDKGPFDGILVAAAPEVVPETLKQQLADGGRMVIPVGGRKKQRLLMISRDGDEFVTRDLEDALFVPFLAGVQR
ncbi:protein-L-isoaspartate(D-aspartate) O-methyltransferase [Oceanobacter mangrovi]|uniref:protein-L-isoaspartate(D-aspartate) O-methyltransferase n=1 Tax=Oceanobacter mangrovi TaxID=2862510 RepID=UPI001FE29C0F|nr:protein-L-isoaspartate(D-aspartate) O-methyltransferase [Oceanobacter mangrovi]